MGKIDELSAIAARLKQEHKSTLRHDESKTVAEILSAALLDTSVDWSGLLAVLEGIPPSPIATAVGETWSELPEDRRRLFLRWVSKRGGERETRRSVQVAAVLLEHDVSAAVDVLTTVLPDSKMPKETKVVIRAAFLAKKATPVTELARPEIPVHSALRITSALRQSVDAESPLTARYSLARLCLACIARMDARHVTEATMLWAATEHDIRSWPSQMQAQFRDENRELASAVFRVPDIPEFFSVRVTVSSRPASQPSPQAPVKEGDLLTKIDERIRTARDEITMLEALREVLVAAPRITKLEKELADSQAIAAGLQQQLGHETARADAANSRVAAAEATAAASANQVNELRAKLAQLADKNKALVAQLTATGEVEVQQFKNGLGQMLARLIIDLPDRSSELSPEAARVLLRQYHLFIDKLVDTGVPVRATSTAR